MKHLAGTLLGAVDKNIYETLFSLQKKILDLYTNNYNKIEFGKCHMRAKNKSSEKIRLLLTSSKSEGQRIIHNIGGL